MQVLENILGEIDNHAIEFESFGMCDDYVSVGWAKEIIRSHMDEVNKDWIPCSERLPSKEEYEQLIITDVHGNVYANVIYGYAEDEDKEPCFHEWDDEYWQCRKYEAIAWQKYPEPYKPNEEPKLTKNTQQELEDFWHDN